MNDNNTTKPSSSEHIRELKIDRTLWATPAKIINLLDFKPEKLSINTNNDTAEPSSSERIKVHQVRYGNGGFYLTIDNIKGYFNFNDNIGTFDFFGTFYFLMIISEINIIKYGKKFLKLLMMEMEN